MCDLPSSCGSVYILYVNYGFFILFCGIHVINSVFVLIIFIIITILKLLLLMVVVNLTLVDLPGLTKVAVGTLSFDYLFYK